MAQINTREICLLGFATITTNGTGSDMILPQGYTAAILTLNVLTVSGTTPTLNVYVQNKMRVAGSADVVGQDIASTGGTTVYDDLISFTQVTTQTSTVVARIVGGGNAINFNKNQTLAAGSAQSGPIGGTWRVAYTVSGTNPSLNASVSCQFIP